MRHEESDVDLSAVCSWLRGRFHSERLRYLSRHLVSGIVCLIRIAETRFISRGEARSTFIQAKFKLSIISGTMGLGRKTHTVFDDPKRVWTCHRRFNRFKTSFFFFASHGCVASKSLKGEIFYAVVQSMGFGRG
jgi:hypothetical protein